MSWEEWAPHKCFSTEDNLLTKGAATLLGCQAPWGWDEALIPATRSCCIFCHCFRDICTRGHFLCCLPETLHGWKVLLRWSIQSKMEQGIQESSISTCQLQLLFSPPPPFYYFYMLELKLGFWRRSKLAALTTASSLTSDVWTAHKNQLAANRKYPKNI